MLTTHCSRFPDQEGPSGIHRVRRDISPAVDGINAEAPPLTTSCGCQQHNISGAVVAALLLQ